MRATFFCLIVCAACGGKVVGEGGLDASADGSGGGGGGGSSECTTLAIQLGALRSQLQSCSPMSRGQCQTLIEDVCCTIAVQSSQTSELTSLVQKYKGTCMAACPPCVPVAKTCQQQGSDPNTGQCR